MANPSNTPNMPKSKLQLLPPDTQVQQCSSQSDSRTGDRTLGRQAVLKDLGRYLQVPYATLIRLAFGSPLDISQVRQKLTEDGILSVLSDGKTLQWARFPATSAQSGASGSINVLESVAFQPLAEIISTIFNQVPSCQVAFSANPSATPLSERTNTSRPDAYVVQGCPAANEAHWFDIAIPFEFKKTKDCSAKYDNEEKMIWSLHHIMREDPLRRFALGITIEDMEMRFWYSNRAFLAVSVPVDFVTDIDHVISLFYLIGSVKKVKLGWDPTVKRVLVGQEIQYKFEIGNQSYITTRPLATYGADAIVGRGTRVYEARDENGNIVAIKDSWREELRESEGAILEKIFKDIRDQLGEQKATEAVNYFVRIRVYEDVVISGALDKTLDLGEVGDIPLECNTINVDTILSEKRHLPDYVHPPTELARWRVRPPGAEIPCRIHTRTIFEEVGTTLTNVTCLADAFICLSGALRALYHLHKVGWVHRDFSVANILWVEQDGQWIGKLTDFEYAKKVSSEVSHDVRTGTMQFMALEVECQRYLFLPKRNLRAARSDRSSTDKPPFRMNSLHDLESLWWAAIWVLFYHTDADSPTEDPDGQQMYFDEAFPCAIRQSSRRDFFSMTEILDEAHNTLSMTYRDECTPVFELADILQECYREAEKSFPRLLLDDNLLEDIHKNVSDALDQLKECDIHLQPLRELQGRKRNMDDSPTHRPAKKAKRA